MANFCILSKKKLISKNKVSHSNIKNKSFSYINFKKYLIWIEKKFKKIKISTKSIKILKKCLLL